MGDDEVSKGVEFAQWSTPVENDDLQFISVSYASTDFVRYGPDGFALQIPPDLQIPDLGVLTALFFSKQRMSIVSFRFRDASAFRVLDEGGLLELWSASATVPRPAQTTFKVRGHAWQTESILAWVHGASADHYSFMIATEWECVEVITHSPPEIEMRPAQVIYDRDPN